MKIVINFPKYVHYERCGFIENELKQIKFRNLNFIMFEISKKIRKKK